MEKKVGVGALKDIKIFCKGDIYDFGMHASEGELSWI